MREPCCGLCGGRARDSGIIFRHARRGERVLLSLVLCDACGDRLEKHLKRAVPKRLMESVPDGLGYPSPGG